ncbi:glycosyltransferase [Acinetobacter guillouiae]|uniref:glycosyltransferase n=1 Tax=Acinetobacter guillouiae TaxID=106649 RepID=UPI003AF85A23
MILIDSVYINDGGGFVLLKYLIETLKNSKLEVVFLFDNRTKLIFNHDGILKNKYFINSSMRDRKEFYIQNKDKFKTILCFGNVPPPIRVKSKVFVYFHQPLFLKIPAEFSVKNKIIYKVKQLVLNYFKNNADIWLTQSVFIKEELAKKYLKNNQNIVKILPFYPPLDFKNFTVERVKDSFVYVSNSAPHKNHENLIHAFCDAFDQTNRGSLVVTVPYSNVVLCDLINKKIKQGYPINNIGFVDRSLLPKLYLAHEYLIFPSFTESFGLGLAEAIDGGCKVLVSDLPYAHQVCLPSLTFNPYTKESMRNAIIEAVTEILPSSKKIVSNDIKQLILLLSE